ncbi:MAG: hypothetical protein AB1330_01230 [Bacillota bacterium]
MFDDLLREELAMVDIDAAMGEEGHASATTVGVVHPVNGASVTVDDHGRIDLFTVGPIGLRFDPRSGKLLILARQIELWCESVYLNGQRVNLTEVN